MNDADAAQVAKALSHPLRIGLIRSFRDQRTLSPVSYARQSGQPLGNVSYHIKVLLEAEVLAVAELVPRRGAMEHFYSLTSRRSGITLTTLELLAGA